MHKEREADFRENFSQRIDCDLAVVGGGMAGVCCAITAARAGIRVVLIQDRPVLGGNSSSEVRLWILGATSHMGNNNRWAREGGVIDEILVENLYRNPEGNPLFFDPLLLEKVTQEPNIILLLNTAVFEVGKSSSGQIERVRAFCSQNSTSYDIYARLFCDSSGDGIVGYLSGAAFRMGAESEAEFGEKLAPSREYGELLGHSLYFYSKNAGRPVKYIPPAFALNDIKRIPRYRNLNTNDQGCQLWWIEYGGLLDTIHDTEKIKWELWKIVYGVWDYIKNSGQFPEAETLTLEWVGQIPGKRESRRFEGDYILRQQDIVDGNIFPDSVSYGGWAMDLHPADGIYSEKPGCQQWHARGIYAIPYRCLYSRNVSNLFLAGRIISATHVAFSSTRVQATLAQAAQAVGLAAAMCIQENNLPADVSRSPFIEILQKRLLRRGQFIPRVALMDEEDVARKAKLSSTSRMILNSIPADGQQLILDDSVAQLLPLPSGPVPMLTFWVSASRPTTLQVELRTSTHPDQYTPDVVLEKQTFPIDVIGEQEIQIHFQTDITEARYVFVCLLKNPDLMVRFSNQRLTGIVSVFNKQVPAVSNYGKQEPVEDIGVETFEFWCPQRRPKGHNLAMKIEPGIDLFFPENVINGWNRPTFGPNAWVADLDDPKPVLQLNWDHPHTIAQLVLGFDTDFDHPMESALMGHPEREIPFCVRRIRVRNGAGKIVGECANNHHTRICMSFQPILETDCLQIEVLEMHGQVPAAIFEVHCYSEKLV